MCTSITRLEAEHRLQEHFNFFRERIKSKWLAVSEREALDKWAEESNLMESFLDIIFSHEVQHDK